MTNIQELQDNILQKSVVSVDIFDTLISRKTATPKGIFFLAEFLAKHGENIDIPDGFAQLRIDAEKKCREIHHPKEITTDQIYDQIANIGASEFHQFLPKMRALEEACEIENAYAIRPVCDLIAEQSPKKETFLLSDMYLSSPVIVSMLHIAQTKLAELPLILSNEHGKSKNAGDLYDVLKAQSGADAGQILHIGDNRYSDIQMARKAHIKSFHIGWTGLDTYEKSLYDTLTNAQSTLKQRIVNELVIGAIRQCRLEQTSESLHKNAAYKLGYQVAGPILFFFVLWILQTAKQKSIKTICFIARDGQVLLEIAKIICRRFGWDFNLKYIYGSRQSWHLPSVTQVTDKELSWILQGLPNLTLGMVARRVELDEAFLVKHFEATSGRKVDPTENLTNEEMEILKLVLQNGAVNEKILKNAENARNIFYKYLEQEGLLASSELCMVDLGWQGRLQDSLHQILNMRSKMSVEGFYFGLIKNNRLDTGKKETFFFTPDTSSKRYKTGRSFINISEIFCSADHGTTLKFHEQNGKFEPVLKEKHNSDALNWGLTEFRKGVAEFSEVISPKIVDNAKICQDEILNLVGKIIDDIRFNPPQGDAAKIGDFAFSGDQREENMRTFAPEFSLADAYEYLFAEGYPQRLYMTAWYEGTLARSSQQVRSLLNPKMIEIADRLMGEVSKAEIVAALTEEDQTSLRSALEGYAYHLIDVIANSPDSELTTKQLNSRLNYVCVLIENLMGGSNKFAELSGLGAFGQPARFSLTLDVNDSHYSRISHNKWAYTHSDANQKLWIAHITPETPTKGIKFVGIMELTSSCDMSVEVTLGRSGNSPYEGASKVIELAAGKKQKVELSKTFEQEHTRLKLQLNVKNCDSDSGEITISSYGIVELMDSLKRRHDMEKLRIKDANKLYRDEKYATSLGLFVALFKKYGLQMYMDNALRAANKIGLSHCRTNQDVLDLFK